METLPVEEPPAPHPPRLPESLESTESPADGIEDDGLYQSLDIADCAFNGASARDPVFAESRLTRVGLESSTLSGPYLRDTILDRCTLANARWEHPIVKRVTFRECRLTGFMAIEGKFEHVTMKGCTAQYAGFRTARFKQSRFERCIFAEADFTDADLSGCVFRECDLSAAQFSGVKLVGADLRGSQLDGLQIGAAELQGSIVDSTQAIILAQLLGITVVP
jgi:uncharacterized protein YjbI with pentapeptide repeats